ncbi:MAG: phosphoribosylaminoimidazolesuccinocarboxamide synthase [Bacteroidota bacterium]
MALSETNFSFPGQTDMYRGKVRDVYFVDDLFISVATDRISAFDHVLPRAIPHKGQVLNQVAAEFLEASRHIIPNWLSSTPHPNVSIGVRCEPIPIEMVIRGHLAGHAWREYNSGKRFLCGVSMPEDMREADEFPAPIITPATKATVGHDEDISREDILAQGLVSAEIYETMEAATQALFALGQSTAAQNDLILVDTKYEFGLHQGQVYLMDEIHTPDSSRYYVRQGFEDRQHKGIPQEQLSKEFVREWLMENDFQGLEGQEMPAMPDEFVNHVSERYIDLYQRITGRSFVKTETTDIARDIKSSILDFLEHEG